MIFWYTDNIISRTVATAFANAGYEVDHIDNFTPQPSIFYGIHRGCGHAMHTCKHTGHDYYYVDNGYFDAEYVDRSGIKETAKGKYRIVKNAMHEKFAGKGYELLPNRKYGKILLIPPSPYSAYFHNTTPEDFIQAIAQKFPDKEFTVRTKAAEVDIESDILAHDIVITFNSMAVIKAVQMGVPVMDTNGIFQRDVLRYDIGDLRVFYEPKQFTLQQIAGGEWTYI